MSRVHPKVRNGSAAAAVAGVVVWLLGRYVLHGTVPAEVTALVDVIVPAVLSFAAGYLTPSPKAAKGNPAAATPSRM